jgi:hypothetical protein
MAAERSLWCQRILGEIHSYFFGLLTMLVENNKNFRAAGAASARCRRA